MDNGLVKDELKILTESEDGESLKVVQLNLKDAIDDKFKGKDKIIIHLETLKDKTIKFLVIDSNGKNEDLK